MIILVSEIKMLNKQSLERWRVSYRKKRKVCKKSRIRVKYRKGTYRGMSNIVTWCPLGTEVSFDDDDDGDDDDDDMVSLQLSISC